MTKKKISGTLEWATDSANCCTGCKNDCRYCYAKHNAVKRFKTVAEGDWTKTIINEKQVNKKWGKKKGTVMFPTTHDIYQENVYACVTCLKNILKAGNNVLIVSKPHPTCIMVICNELEEYKENILFRFTIGCSDDKILQYWEPNAPKYIERVTALIAAHSMGFKTSVSMEPALDVPNIQKTFDELAPFVTDSIWIGKLNNIGSRVDIKTDEDRKAVMQVEAGQTDESVRWVYELLKDRKEVKWKESYKSVLGLELPEEPGQDI